MQIHHVIYFDTASEKWYVDPQTDAYFPDGEVWDYAGSQEWEPVPDSEIKEYMNQIAWLSEVLNGDRDVEGKHS